MKNVDKIIAEVMRLEELRSREEVFAQFPKLAQWWAQEYSVYSGHGESKKASQS